MKSLPIFLATILSVLASSASATQLTELGNTEVRNMFQRYLQESSGCQAAGNGKRILLTGFGPFGDVQYNISGAIAANIADPAIWPAQVPLNARVSLARTTNLQSGRYPRGNGAKVFNRSIEIGGQPFSLCVIVLDVLWDLAGAIVSYEMNRFQPEAVLMMGGATGPRLEGGASNTTSLSTGYYADGRESNTVKPVSLQTLPQFRKEHVIQAIWNSSAIHDSLRPYLRRNHMSLNLATPGSAALTGTYLCNQTSYIALASAHNLPIDLASGQIHLEPRMQSLPQVGFFHLQKFENSNRADITKWGSLVTSILYFMSQR